MGRRRARRKGEGGKGGRTGEEEKAIEGGGEEEGADLLESSEVEGSLHLILRHAAAQHLSSSALPSVVLPHDRMIACFFCAVEVARECARCAS